MFIKTRGLGQRWQGCNDKSFGREMSKGIERRKGYSVLAKQRLPDTFERTKIANALLEVFPELYESPSSAKKSVRRKTVLVNNVVANNTTEVTSNDMVEIICRVTATLPMISGEQTQKLTFTVQLEDEHIGIIVKPFGVSTMGRSQDNVMSNLSHNLRQSEAPIDESRGILNRPRPAHRLDRATGGLLMCCKTTNALRILSMRFDRREVRKTYAALVHGRPSDETGILDMPLSGKEAVTHYKLVNTYKIGEDAHISKLLLFPKTGRFHQLRLHLSGAGWPIVGDREYCPKALMEEYGKHGMFLWAQSLQFDHPITNKFTEIECSPPPTFTTFPEQLQRNYLKSG